MRERRIHIAVQLCGVREDVLPFNAKQNLENMEILGFGGRGGREHGNTAYLGPAAFSPGFCWRGVARGYKQTEKASDSKNAES